MARTKKQAKKPSEILGLERMEKATVKGCQERAKTLRARVEKGEFKGDKLEMARRWANWYQAKANQLRGAK